MTQFHLIALVKLTLSQIVTQVQIGNETTHLYLTHTGLQQVDSLSTTLQSSTGESDAKNRHL